jgi:hypothetical protein
MPVHTPADTGLRWATYNALIHLLGAMGVPRMLVRYENLVAAPRRQISRILQQTGVEVEDSALDFIDESGVTLRPDHTVAGNPMRFEQGAVPLRLDGEWRAGMRALDRRIVTLETWLLLWRYGYLGSAGASKADPPAGRAEGRR